jgi:hypothetical protein
MALECHSSANLASPCPGLLRSYVNETGAHDVVAIKDIRVGEEISHPFTNKSRHIPVPAESHIRFFVDYVTGAISDRTGCG